MGHTFGEEDTFFASMCRCAGRRLHVSPVVSLVSVPGQLSVSYVDEIRVCVCVCPHAVFLNPIAPLQGLLLPWSLTLSPPPSAICVCLSPSSPPHPPHCHASTVLCTNCTQVPAHTHTHTQPSCACCAGSQSVLCPSQHVSVVSLEHYLHHRYHTHSLPSLNLLN